MTAQPDESPERLVRVKIIAPDAVIAPRPGAWAALSGVLRDLGVSRDEFWEWSRKGRKPKPPS